jgi:predicted LPLAT superfamily acyltransferase
MWFFVLIAWSIASGYFFFFPKRVKASVSFFRALFPYRSYLYYLWCAWRQYHNFIYVYLDRWLLKNDEGISCTQEGWEYIEEVIQKKTGGLILMSHLGNWEIAAYFMSRQSRNNPKINLLLYLGSKRNEQIERIQKEELIQSGVKIITAEENAGSPFDILEGIQFLKNGGFVSIAGDRLWNKNQRAIAVRFLGHEVLLPESPFIFSLLSHSPILIFFANRLGKGKYHCVVYPPKYVIASSRHDRQAAIKRSAQEYVNILEEMVLRYPYEWYHFEPFLGRRLRRGV